MKGIILNIDEETVGNHFFRKVIFTAKNSQLVLMSLEPGEDIGMETHDVDQFFRIEKGVGMASVDGEEHMIEEDDAIVVPAGVEHNIINTSETDELKLYTVYSPPNHPDGTIHMTKEDADKDEEGEK